MRLLLSDPSLTTPSDTALDLLDLQRLYAHAEPVGPWLRANMVASLDGRATIDDRSKGLSNDGDMDVFAVLRSLADVVIVGAGTARAENYRPATVRPPLQPLRTERGQDDVPAVAIISGSLHLDPDSALIRDPRTIVFTHKQADPDQRAALSATCTVIDAGDDAVDLAAVRQALTDRGMPRMLCEGGPTLLASFAIADLVDELCLTLAPIVAIAPGHPVLERIALPSQDPQGMSLVHVLEDEGFLLLRHQRSASLPGRSS